MEHHHLEVEVEIKLKLSFFVIPQDNNDPAEIIHDDIVALPFNQQPKDIQKYILELQEGFVKEREAEVEDDNTENKALAMGVI